MPVSETKFDGFTSEQAEAIRTQAIDFWDTATNAQVGLNAMVNDCERVARVQLPKELAQKFEGVDDMAQLMPPDAFINLRSLTAGLYKLIFTRKPYGRLSVEGKPHERSERIEKAQWTLQHNLDIQHEGAGYESAGMEALYQLLCCGITCTVTNWVKRFERKAVRDEQHRIYADPKTKRPIFNQEMVAEYGQTDHIDIRRVRIDPSVSNLKDARIVGFQSTISLSKLLVQKRNSDTYIRFDEKELIDTSFDRDKYFEYVDGEGQTYSERGGENLGFGDKLVELWEIRGIFRLEKKDGTFDFQDLIVIMANREKLIGLSYNDLPLQGWQLFDFPYISAESGRAFRMGIIEPLFDELIELFIKRNQSLDESNQTTHGMYLADAAATASVEDYIEHYRGRVIKVDASGSGLSDVSQAFREFPRPQSTQETFKHSLQLKAELKEGMGVSDYMQGTDPERAETATGVTALVTGGMSNLELLAFFLKISMFAPNWRKTLILWNFFKGHEENVVYDVQGKAIQVLPGDIDFFYKIDIDIATAMDYPAMVRRFVESYPTMINDPYWDQYEIRNTFKEVLQLPNGEKLLKPPQHLAEIIERENIALLNASKLVSMGDTQAGTIFVSEFDDDSQHIIGHTKLLDMLIQSGLPTEPADVHIEEHQMSQEAKQEGQKGLGNSKNFGGNAGQNLSSENASNKSVPASGGGRRRVA